MERLLAYRWPGNIRELENAIERAAVTTVGDTINPENLPRQVTGIARRGTPAVRDRPEAAPALLPQAGHRADRDGSTSSRRWRRAGATSAAAPSSAGSRGGASRARSASTRSTSIRSSRPDAGSGPGVAFDVTRSGRVRPMSIAPGAHPMPAETLPDAHGRRRDDAQSPDLLARSARSWKPS